MAQGNDLSIINMPVFQASIVFGTPTQASANAPTWAVIFLPFRPNQGGVMPAGFIIADPKYLVLHTPLSELASSLECGALHRFDFFLS